MGKLTDYQKMELLEKYGTGKFSCQQIANCYGISRMAVRQFLKRRGIKRNNDRATLSRKYTLNENYFDIIDTEKKAYFLGLLYADGCNQEHRGSITIQLQESDKHILEELNNEIGSNKPLYFYERNKKNQKWKNDFKLEINSHKMSKRLKELGVIRDKALILEFPSEKQVPKYLIRHFIRGYFDGDGCVGIYKNKKNINKAGYSNVTCNITSSNMFCLPIKNILKEELDINSSIVLHKNGKSTRHLVIGGNKQAIKFLNWIYADCLICINRKLNKYIDIKNYLQERYGY